MLARRPTDDSKMGAVLLARDELAALSSMARVLMLRRTGVVNVSSCEAGPSSVGASVPVSPLPAFIAIRPLLAAITLVRSGPGSRALCLLQAGTSGSVGSNFRAISGSKTETCRPLCAVERGQRGSEG